MPEKKTPPDGLAGMDFAAIFATDLEPERLDFKIGGNAAWVELRPMDSTDANRFEAMAAKVYEDNRVRADATEEQILNLQAHLIEKTLVDWCLWRRLRLGDGTLGDWQQDRPSDDERQRRAQLREYRTTPEFWGHLIRECMRANRLGAEAQGN